MPALLRMPARALYVYLPSYVQLQKTRLVTSGCMHVRNRHLVDFSSYCICYQTKETGGTAYTVNYAKENGLIIYNVAQ